MNTTESPYYGIAALAHNDSQNWEALQRTRFLQTIGEIVLWLIIGCALCFTL